MATITTFPVVYAVVRQAFPFVPAIVLALGLGIDSPDAAAKNQGSTAQPTCPLSKDRPHSHSRVGHTSRHFNGLLTLSPIPGSEHKTSAWPKEWTPADRWAWCEFRRGRPADFDEINKIEKEIVSTEAADLAHLKECMEARNALEECKVADLESQDRSSTKLKASPCGERRFNEVSGEFIRDVMTDSRWAETLPSQGVRLKHALIAGDIDLEDSKLRRPLHFEDKTTICSINLSRAHTDSDIFIRDAVILNSFRADRFRSDSDMELIDIVFSPDAELDAPEHYAIRTISQTFNTCNYTAHHVFSLRGANVSGNINLVGSRFRDTFEAESLSVGGDLTLSDQGKARTEFSKNVNLNGANIIGNARALYGTFNDRLNARNINVHGDFILRNANVNEGIDMSFSNIDGNLDLRGAHFINKDFDRSGDIQRDDVLRALLSKDCNDFLDPRARGKFHDKRNSPLEQEQTFHFDFKGASVKRRLRLGNMDDIDLTNDMQNYKANANPNDANIPHLKRGNKWLGIVNLRDMQVGYSPEPLETDAWPEAGCVLLDGFGFSHLARFEEEDSPRLRPLGDNSPPSLSSKVHDSSLNLATIWEKADVQQLWQKLTNFVWGLPGPLSTQNSNMQRWDKEWIRHDGSYSPSPYLQLAAVLTSSGRPVDADEIRFLGRERQKENLYAKGEIGAGIWQSTLRWGAGYGIGRYAFIAALWLLILLFLGCSLLLYVGAGKQHWERRDVARRIEPLAKRFQDRFSGSRTAERVTKLSSLVDAAITRSVESIDRVLWCIFTAFGRIAPFVSLLEFKDFFDGLDKSDTSAKAQEKADTWQNVENNILPPTEKVISTESQKVVPHVGLPFRMAFSILSIAGYALVLILGAALASQFKGP